MVGDEVELHLLHNDLVKSLAAPPVLAPPSGDAVALFVDNVGRGNTGNVDVATEIKLSVEVQQGDVVRNAGVVKQGMDGLEGYVAILVRNGFNLGTGVPFAAADLNDAGVEFAIRK